ncbi:MAG: helix-turn-helix transcriptional regulator [Phycisphaerae bacterium]
MSAKLTHAPLYRGPALALADVCCAAPRSPAAPEEFSRACTLAFPRRGVFVKHVGPTTLVADSNVVVFFNRDEPYRVSHPVDGGDDCTVLRLREALLRDVLAALDPGAADRSDLRFGYTHAPAEPRWLLRIEALRRHLAQPSRDVLAAEEVAGALVAAVVGAAQRVRGVRLPRRANTADEHRRLANDTQVLLATRFAEPLTLAELAEIVAASPFHLARVFRRQTGRSLHAYRTRLRLAATLPALADGAPDLARVALRVGFASHSHFTTAFQQHFDVTPSAARGRIAAGLCRETSTISKA